MKLKRENIAASALNTKKEIKFNAAKLNHQAEDKCEGLSSPDITTSGTS